MSVTVNRTIRTNNPKQKHTWLEQEDRLCAYLYLHGKSYLDAHRLLPHIPISSIKFKFQNCAYLEKKSPMSHCSKQNVRVFTEERERLLSHIFSSSHK
jgi:hypothetical protein